MCGIETLVIFSVTSLHLSVVPWSKWSNLLVLNAMHSQASLKSCQVRRGIGYEAFCEFQSVVCLDALNRKRKGLQQMLWKDSGCVGVMLIKGLHKTPSGGFIDRCVPVEFLTFRFVNQTDCRNIFYINLEPRAGIEHLFIQL